MDPKSCRQTPHWNIAMICSPFLLWFHFTSPVLSHESVFLSWMFRVTLMTVSTPGLDRCGSTRGIFSRGLALQSSKPRKCNTRSVQCHVFFVPSFLWHFLKILFCASLEAFISVLNIACCAPSEELLCVWRRRWRCCWGGAKLVAEGHGWQGGYFNVQKGQSSPLPSDPHMTE